MKAELATQIRSVEPGQRAAGQDFWTACCLLCLLLSAQLYLVYFKSFNWDEFFHFSYVYKALDGTLTTGLNGLQFRLLSWTPGIAENLVDQLRFARLFIWGCWLIALAAIYGLACQFESRTNALFATLSYAAAGYVFTQAFSIRADAIAAAVLMSALYVFSAGRLTFTRAVSTGALVGLASMLTMKSVFYAPCFAGLAWWRFVQAQRNTNTIMQISAVVIAAMVSFLLIFALHSTTLLEVPGNLTRTESFLDNAGRWFFSAEGHTRVHIARQSLLAFLFVFCIVISPVAWRRSINDYSVRIALSGLLAPLLFLLVYRNTFPYFFVFIFAPATVAIAPALGVLRDRYGGRATLALLVISPSVLTFLEPRDVQQRQEALIEYVHDEYPEPVPYLAFTGVISDYPMILAHMAGGPGMDRYNEMGYQIVAEQIKAGELAFVIGDRREVLDALLGRPGLQSFMLKDAEVLESNFVQQWGPLFRAGKEVPAGRGALTMEIPHAGQYTLDGEALSIDGHLIQPGSTMFLKAGPHSLAGPRHARSVLWRAEKLPSPPPFDWVGSFYTEY